MLPKVYKEFEPDQYLRQFIKCYWLFENEYMPNGFEHVYPDSSYELAYTQKVTYAVDGQQLPRLYFVGQLQKPADFYAVGAVRQWAVRFYPWGLQPFGEVETIGDKVWTDARNVMDSTEQLESIMAQHDDRRVIADLDTYFLKQLLLWQFDDKVLQRAFDELRRQKGNIKIKDLADYCYISRRQLGRKIVAATGRSPHDIASRLRFEKVRDSILHNPDIPLTFLAHQYGYTDQSHLIKEFRHYMDGTPSQFADLARSQQPRIKRSQNVLFLQLDKPETA